MRITGGILVLVAAILCISTGSCNLTGAVASRVGKSAIRSGLKLLEQNVGATARAGGQARGFGAQSEARTLSRIKKKTTEILDELEGSSATMLLAGVASLLGGLLAYAASVLLLVERSRGFILFALALASAGTGLAFFTPFTVQALQVGKLLLLGFGFIAALGIPPRRAAGAGAEAAR